MIKSHCCNSITGRKVDLRPVLYKQLLLSISLENFLSVNNLERLQLVVSFREYLPSV